jgi:hypothetical protein
VSAHIGISKKDFVLDVFTAPPEIYYRRDYPSVPIMDGSIIRKKITTSGVGFDLHFNMHKGIAENEAVILCRSDTR